MICFEPVQVSTGLPYYRRPITIKVATNLTRRVHFYWSIGDVRETRVCLPALGAEGTLLAGGSPYPARPARNKDSVAHRHDCLNCKHQPNICRFFSVLQAQILDIASITGAGKCRLKNVQHSLNGFAFRSTPPFHRHSIIHPVLFILCSSI